MFNFFQKCLLLFILITTVSISLSQEDTITLTVSVPDWMVGGMTDAAFESFEEAHPGVEVVYIPRGEIPPLSSPAFATPDEYFQGVKDYAVKADVLYIYNLNEVSVESTRAGYWLDLAPLIAADPNFDAGSFYPSLWESYQWERGVWALPVKTDIYLLYYDRDAFDAAGVAYPRSDWTLDDFAAAVRALSVQNPDGSTQPAFASWDDAKFIRSLTAESLYNPDTVEHLPNFGASEWENVLQTWAQLYDKGVVRGFSSTLSSTDVPMFVDRSWTLYNTQERNLGAVLLPNESALLDVSAFAVSGGTQHPELAYALAEYLTRTPEVVPYINGDMAARPALNEAAIEGVARFTRSAEQQALIEEALVNAIPLAEFSYRDYLSPVIGQIIRGESDGVDFTQLDQALTTIRDIYTAASAHAETNTFAVNSPPQPPTLAEGEIALTLGVNMNVSPLPNQDLWQAFLNDFIAADPQVGAVELFSRWEATPQAYFDNSDCVVSSSDLIPLLDASTALALTPLLQADADFDETEYLNGVLSMVQREETIWGLPLAAYTEMLWYRSQTFEELGLETPLDGWTTAEFGAAVTTLATANPDQPVLVPSPSNGNYLLMLMAAYGALPFDYRTQPPTVNLTDAAVVEGVRQVLDLARDGMIEYQELDQESTGGIFSGLATSPLLTVSMYDQGFMLPRNLFGGTGAYQLAPYPTGTEFTPVMFSLKVGYITASTAHQEACYRLLKALSERPDLLNGLPVRRLESVPLLTLRDGNQDISAFYNALVTTLNQPNVIVMRETRFMSYHETQWLQQAFDAYVLEDATLEISLENAQLKITEYRACIGELQAYQPTLNTTSQDVFEAQQPYLDCAAQVEAAFGS